MKSNKLIFKNCKKHFSVIHNYHSPSVIYVNGREIIHDEKLNEYNKYIQAFLNKRFTHKKEIYPKISILEAVPSYHDTFYIQKSFPFYTMTDISHLKFLHSLKLFDTCYIISRFFEANEKLLFDAKNEKLLVSGRVPFMEDIQLFENLKVKIDELIKKFYEGDKLSEFERSIERAYLILKQGKYEEFLNKNSGLKKQDVFLSFSERNKMSGHINFRMHDMQYFFKPAPIFETINVEKMFFHLYEIRYNVLNKFDYWKKLKLNFQYRKSLLSSKHRTEFVSSYIFLQVLQYVDCYEFNEEFKLNLNFKVTYNLILLHFWVIINKLKKIKNNKFSENLVNQLLEKIYAYAEESRYKFGQLDLQSDKKIILESIFVNKIFDNYSFHFYLKEQEAEKTMKANYYENIRNLINSLVFENKLKYNDKRLLKVSSYLVEHYKYFNKLSYEEIEKTDFSFSIYRIPVNYDMFVLNNDKVLELNDYSAFYYDNLSKYKFILNIKNNNFNKNIFINKSRNKKGSEEEQIKNILKLYGLNPNKDSSNYYKFNIKNSWIYRLGMYYRKELSPYADLIGKEESRKEYNLNKLKSKDDINVFDELKIEKLEKERGEGKQEEVLPGLKSLETLRKRRALNSNLKSNN